MTNHKDKTIRVGSRKSELALIQTKHVIARLQKLYPKKKFEIHTMSTIGDRVLNISLPKIGEKSLFTRDLEDALRNGGVDFVVHSLKDLPTALPTGMAIGAVLEREDARDALVLREEYKGHTIETLPKGCVIGTSSLRRTAQIRRQYPHLTICDIRGNLNTRLAKLDATNSKFAGIVLAQAGLVRMGWEQRISQVLEPTDLLYAVGQGALAVECRANDEEVLSMLQSLMCLSTTCRILAERSFLKTLGGGCSAPVAVWSNLDGDLTETNQNNCNSALSLVGAVWSLDGATEIRDKKACSFAVEEVKKADNNDNANLVEDSDDDSSDQPPTKRRRSNESSSPEQRHSPPVINDDAEIEKLTTAYSMGDIIEKHISLAKHCPVISADLHKIEMINNAENGNDNGNISANLDLRASGDSNANNPHCPLKMDVGQDFMGECPFVSKEEKITLATAGKCPVTKELVQKPKEETDNVVVAALPSTSKCPFASMHSTAKDNEFSSSAPDAAAGKCPFLQKTVKMFDYADEEKPQPKSIPVLIEDVDNLYCGLYQHACYNRELYKRSDALGQQLAEELIKKGALEVMKCAQAEIHSKA
ncbi:porphobilinogen deaminase isoform X1 [Bactrocera tryoni]|uniref:porphobilinogen deaminase isoform X1 n=2 Tax=Bactrocera tryoni TaxID=59916 RepID=UPI001A99302C|nr:porphobilinogen deaminase isoform X1 [Bactrocera tryoni]